MGAVKLQPGNRVLVKGTDLTGTVTTLNPVKDGSRGRPKTYASVILPDGSEITRSVPELKIL